jgi:competence protein ComEA
LALSLCAVCLVAGGVAWRWIGRPAPLEDRIPMAAGATTSAPAGASPPGAAGSSAADAGDGTATPAATPQESGELVVHVVGAVGAPGVVRVGVGSRVIDAVAAAGGLAPGADAQRVNLAAPVVDGSRIVVPAVGQEVPAEVPTSLAGPGAAPGAAGAGAASPAAPVDLNTATAEQLDSLPGVGPATAEAILAHREAHGPFTSVEQLLDVRGIGEAKLESLRDLVVAR